VKLMHTRWTYLALSCAVALVATAAQATMVVAVPQQRMTREAEVIVHARVGDQRVTWDEKRVRVLTITTIEVIEAVKGARKGDVLEIYQVGGTLDGVTFKIAGALEFKPGQEMILFAMRYEQRLVSYGMGLGKYRVEGPAGAQTVVPEYGNVAFVKPAADGQLIHDEVPDTSPRALAAFLAELRQTLRSEVKGGSR